MKVTTFDLSLRGGQPDFPDFRRAALLMNQLFAEAGDMKPDADLGQDKVCGFAHFQMKEAEEARSEALIVAPLYPFTLRVVRLNVPEKLVKQDFLKWKKANPQLVKDADARDMARDEIRRSYLKKAIPEPADYECAWDTEHNRLYLMSGSTGVVTDFMDAWAAGDYAKFPMLKLRDCKAVCGELDADAWEVANNGAYAFMYSDIVEGLLYAGSDFLLSILKNCGKDGSFHTPGYSLELGKSAAFVGGMKSTCSVRAKEILLDTQEVLSALREGKKPKWITAELRTGTDSVELKLDHSVSVLSMKAIEGKVKSGGFDYEAERLAAEIELWNSIVAIVEDSFKKFLPAWSEPVHKIQADLRDWIDQGWGESEPIERTPEDEDDFDYEADHKGCFNPDEIDQIPPRD